MWYLVKKSISKKYRLMNIVVELDQVTIKSANLLFFTSKFSKKFVYYAISFLIDFYSHYNQVKLD